MYVIDTLDRYITVVQANSSVIDQAEACSGYHRLQSTQFE